MPLTNQNLDICVHNTPAILKQWSCFNEYHVDPLHSWPQVCPLNGIFVISKNSGYASSYLNEFRTSLSWKKSDAFVIDAEFCQSPQPLDFALFY